MSVNPNDVERQFRHAAARARGYWYEDGLVELLLGTVFLALGAYFAVAALFGHPAGTAGVLLNVLSPALVVAVALAIRRFVRRAKERYVYPRTGFVRYTRGRCFPRWLLALAAGGLAGLTTALVGAAPGSHAWLPAIQGFLVGGLLLWQGLWAAVPRLVGLGMLAPVAGVLVSLAGLSSETSGAILFGALGLATAAAGLLAFRRYLRGAPPPQEA